MMKDFSFNAVSFGVLHVVFDVARVRGLYTSLSDGWTYLTAHRQPQIPETVSAAVARGFRLAPVMASPELAVAHLGSPYSPGFASPSLSLAHEEIPSNPCMTGQLGADASIQSALNAIADLTDTTADAVVLGPSLDVLYARLAQAIQPLFRRGGQVVAVRADARQLNHPETVFAESDLGTGALPVWQYSSLVSGVTRVVSLSTAHAQVGTAYDVSQIADMVRDRSRAWVLVDATPTAGYSPISLEELGAHIVGIDCAAFGGPQVAALAFRSTAMFQRIDMSAFSCDVAPGLAAGVSAAVDHLADLSEDALGTRRKRLEQSLVQVGEYVDYLASYLTNSLSLMQKVHVFGISGELAMGEALRRVPRVTFCLPGIPAERIFQGLLERRLVTAAATPDPLLRNMGLDEVDVALTVGLGPYNTTHDVDQLVRALAAIY